MRVFFVCQVLYFGFGAITVLNQVFTAASHMEIIILPKWRWSSKNHHPQRLLAPAQAAKTQLIPALCSLSSTFFFFSTFLYYYCQMDSQLPPGLYNDCFQSRRGCTWTRVLKESGNNSTRHFGWSPCHPSKNSWESVLESLKPESSPALRGLQTDDPLLVSIAVTDATVHYMPRLGVRGSSADCVLWAHNDNDAKQSWTITGLTVGWRKRLSWRTVTHWHVASNIWCAPWAWDYCGFTRCVYRLRTASRVRQEVVGQAAWNQKYIPKTWFYARGSAAKVELFCLWRLQGMTMLFLLKNFITLSKPLFVVEIVVSLVFSAIQACGFDLNVFLFFIFLLF